MIGFLRGKIIGRTEKSVCILCGDIGYEVFLTQEFLTRTGQNETIEIWTYTHVREDILAIYGFENIEDKILFQKLTGISGVGTRTALDILNTPRETLITAISTSNASILTTIPGIGRKTAEKLLPDLRSIFEKNIPLFKPAQNQMPHKFSIDIINALENLGFRRDIILKTLSQLPETTTSEEDIMRFALREMSAFRTN